jgi:hypothetical protein
VLLYGYVTVIVKYAWISASRRYMTETVLLRTAVQGLASRPGNYMLCDNANVFILPKFISLLIQLCRVQKHADNRDY